ncbi:MAG TPA: hypothetical protein VJA26_09840 [Gammaproteobacteria bacterium]|jgi:hypothetical protein|nr:hypothetical protein [Gammaproteobacteria bacterium]
MKRISSDEAKGYLARWSVAAEAERRELRETPMEVKLRQLAMLMASAGLFPDPGRAPSEEDVRARWVTIRRAYGLE